MRNTSHSKFQGQTLEMGAGGNYQKMNEFGIGLIQLQSQV